MELDINFTKISESFFDDLDELANKVVKGLGKLALFYEGARAIASNPAPILDAIGRINPEWADIGSLKATIDSN